MPDMATGSVDANGIPLPDFTMGDGPLVLGMHGFPDHAYTYSYLLPEPAAARGGLVPRYDRLKGIWNAYFFQMPFAETAVAANGYAFLESWWRDASPAFRPVSSVLFTGRRIPHLVSV